MSDLHQQQCEACSADAPRLNDDEIQALLKDLPEWEVDYVDEIPILTREFSFKNFVEALAFTNKVGDLAEQAQHHPAIVTEYGKVTVDWWTHKIKGLHKNDFIMAAKTNHLA
ncbi:MAG TPA: 4a-hydroxytetrahydrobiopterin dehydratase [Cellvibrionaceae bacterium]